MPGNSKFRPLIKRFDMLTGISTFELGPGTCAVGQRATEMAPVQGRGWHQRQPAAVPALTAIWASSPKSESVDTRARGSRGRPEVGLVAAVS